MIVVTAVAFDSTLKTAMQQFIAMYFDGNAHLVNGTPISFPLASASFNRPILDRPLPVSVMVNFQQLPSSDQEFRARNLRRKVDYATYIITNDPSGYLQDKASECLGVIFSQCRDVLAKSGIKVERVGAPITVGDPYHEYGITQRVIRLLVELPGGATNWNGG